MTLKQKFAGAICLIAAAKIGEARGFVKGVQKAVNSIDESAGIDRLRIRQEFGKDSFYELTVRRKS